ncbi:MAG: hypothetical protein M3N41_11565, partial [Acidobacteriota bacterium]|nr:hypothetical protein [Acidobacteriota bacterium]
MKNSLDKSGEADPFRESPEPNATISEALVLQELQRVLASQTFHAALAQKKFLSYAVEHTITGCAHEVKEYTVGVEVFRRGQSFDPRLDPIVRVEARKLRSRLAKYYEGEGERNPLRINLPSRGYVPTFEHVTEPSPHLPSASSAQDGSDDTPLGPVAGEVSPNLPPSPAPQSNAAILKTLVSVRWRTAGLIGAALILAAAVIYGGRLVLASRGGAHVTPSIAVLPFQNLGDSKDQSFADGLTDDLIDSLGTVQGLQVVARTSSFQFRSKTLDIREIGRKLNVGTVLEGSVRVYGNRLRITAQLDDTLNGYRLWSNSYERSFEDALFVQRDISQAIVAALLQGFDKIGTPLNFRFSPGKTVSVKPEAYQNYLRGVYFWNKQTAESIKTAMQYFEQAIAQQADYALPYTGLARCYMNIPAFTTARTREVIPKIRELASKALDLDSGLSEPHIELAFAAFLE